MPVYFIRSEQIHQGKIEIGGDLAHHLKDVLRCREGESILLVDEQPRRYLAKIVGRSSTRLNLEILKAEDPPQRRLPTLRLGLGLLKGEKMDWVLQKATELGVMRISPLQTARTTVAPKSERLERQRGRWMKIVLEAAQQSGRWDIPQVDPPSDFRTFLAETASSAFKLIFWEEASPSPLRPLLMAALQPSETQGTILIGPEGGLEKSEIEEARRIGYQVLSLGPRILRAETAVMAALAIVQYELEGAEGK
jgi:16S rRNA (uracil1498-N3)-methyltransferase